MSWLHTEVKVGCLMTTSVLDTAFEAELRALIFIFLID